MSVLSRLLDRVLLLEDREVITLSFSTQGDMLSKKVLLYREKTKYETKMKNEDSFREIFITQKCNKDFNRFELELSLGGTEVDWIASATVGIRLGKKVALALALPDKAVERLEQLKREIQ